MKASSTLVGLIIVAALAGCADQPPAACEDVTCPSSLPSTDVSGTPDPTDLPPDPVINATLSAVVLEDCRGLRAGIDVDPDMARPFVPEAFRPQGALPFTTLFTLYAASCSRAVVLNQTLENVALVWTGVWVIPENESWEKTGGEHRYVYDVIASHEALSGALSTAGIDAVHGDVVIDVTEAEDQLVVEDWSVTSPNLGLEFRIKHEGEAVESRQDYNSFLWFGEGPFDRFEFKQAARTLGLLSGEHNVLTVSGSSDFHAAVGDVNRIHGDLMTLGTLTFTAEAERFEA